MALIVTALALLAFLLPIPWPSLRDVAVGLGYLTTALAIVALFSSRRVRAWVAAVLVMLGLFHD